jgi:hypothetical protein
MHITIESPSGSRTGVVPYDGVHDELTLVKSLVLTLALERSLGTDGLTLKVDFDGADPERLVEIAKDFGQLAARPAPSMQPYVGPIGDLSAKYLKGSRRTTELLDALQNHVRS